MDIRVQDEQGNVHVFPDGSTPDMIAKVMNVKPPSATWEDTHFGPGGFISPNSPQWLQKFGHKWDTVENTVMGSTVGNASEAVDAAKAGQYARAGDKAFKATAATLSPFVAKGLAAAPLATAAAVGTGMAGGAAGKGIAGAMGASPDQAELVGDVAGVGTGAVGAGLVSAPARKAAASMLSRLSDSVDPELVGVFSPRLAHAMRIMQKVGKVITPAEAGAEASTAASTAPQAGMPAVGPFKALPPGPIELGPGEVIEPPITKTPGKIVARDPQTGRMRTFFTNASAEEAGPTQYQTEQAAQAKQAAQNLEPPANARFSRPMSGESAALQSIPANMDNLLSIAHQRGIPIPKGATAEGLLKDIVGSLSEKELAEFEAQAAERSRFPRTVPTSQAQPSVPAVGPFKSASFEPESPQFAYRVRDAGEKGVMPRGHAQATMDQAQAESYISGRGNLQGQNQELVRIDLSKLDPSEYTLKAGPGGKQWVQFKKPVPESFIQKVSQPETDWNANTMQRNLEYLRRLRSAKAGDD